MNVVAGRNGQWPDRPLRWHKPRRVFACARGDLFHPAVPDALVGRVSAVQAPCPSPRLRWRRSERTACGRARHARPVSGSGRGLLLQAVG
nr:DUF5131 family protein [Rhodovulum viride]